MNRKQEINKIIGEFGGYGRMKVTEIHNSDQGAQYTSLNYINVLEENKIKIIREYTPP